MSANGTVVAYGAIYGVGKRKGAAKVLSYNKENDTWDQLGQLIKGDNKADFLGANVKLSANGEILAVSSHDFDDDRGYVKIFKYSKKKKKWKQLGSTIEGENNDDGSGWGLSLSENGLIVAIGAYGNDDGNIGGDDDDDDAGHTRIFKYSKSEKDWQQMGDDIDGNGDENYDGNSVDLSANGKTVVIGGPYYLNSDSEYVGRVRVFTFKTKKGKWVQVGQDIIGENGKDEFGIAVSMNASGKTIAISSGCEYYCGDPGVVVNNRVEMYRLVGSNWEKIGDSIYAQEDVIEFGSVVSLSADGKSVALNAKLGNKYYAKVYNLIDEDGQLEWSQPGDPVRYKPWKNKDYDWHNDILALSSDGKSLVVGSTFEKDSDVRVYKVDPLE